MIAKNTKLLRGMSFGLSIVALLAVVVALIVGYRKNGEINFVLIALAAVVLSTNLLVIKKSRRTSNE